jgi:hypothetical protein
LPGCCLNPGTPGSLSKAGTPGRSG